MSPSSAILGFDYDAGAQVLDVTFVTKRRYRYFAVPAATASAFARAESKGRFFNQSIRDHFAFEERAPARS